MSTFYIQLADKLLQISGELTKENISKALGYTPSSFSGYFKDLQNSPIIDEDNGELNITDEEGNIIAKIDSQGIHTIDVYAGEHVLSNKADKQVLDNYVTKDKFTFDSIADSPIDSSYSDRLLIVDNQSDIGLILDDEGLKVKDVKAGEHILSNKANLSEIPSLDGYATEKYVDIEIDNINFYNIQDNPIDTGQVGTFTVVDPEGNIGFKIDHEGVHVKDVISKDHILSNKQDQLVSGVNIKTINGEPILGQGDISVSGDITSQTIIDWGFNLGTADVDESIEAPEIEYATVGYVDQAIAERTTPEAELVVRIKQDGDNAELYNVKAKVTYGNKQVELSSGAKVLVPVGEDVTVEFPKLEGYKRPDTMKLTMSENGNTVNAIYKGALVTLNVSTYDGQSVDGQVVTVQKTVTIDCTPDYDRIDELGVAIMDIYGKFYRDADEWIEAGRPTPNGIAVSDGTHRFCIAMQNTGGFDSFKNLMISLTTNGEVRSTEIDDAYLWGWPLLPALENLIIEIPKSELHIWRNTFDRNAGILNILRSASGELEFKEIQFALSIYKHTAPIFLASLGAYDVTVQCFFDVFPNKNFGYIASSGEWYLVATLVKKIDTLLSSIGGNPLGLKPMSFYWTGTCYNDKRCVLLCAPSDMFALDGTNKVNPGGTLIAGGDMTQGSIRPFCSLEPVHQTITTSERLVVKNGKVTFHTPYEAVNSILLGDKEGYRTPERLEFKTDGYNNTVNVQYREHTSMTVNYSFYAGDQVSVVFEDAENGTEFAMHDVSMSGSQLLMDIEEGTVINTGLKNYAGNYTISGDTTFTFTNGGTVNITITDADEG